MTVNPKSIPVGTKGLGRYLQSLTMTAVVAGCMPLAMMGVIIFVLGMVQACVPGLDIYGQGIHHLIDVLTELGSGNPRQGVITMIVTASLVGMLFDTYTFCHGRSGNYRPGA